MPAERASSRNLDPVAVATISSYFEFTFYRYHGLYVQRHYRPTTFTGTRYYPYILFIPRFEHAVDRHLCGLPFISCITFCFSSWGFMLWPPLPAVCIWELHCYFSQII